MKYVPYIALYRLEEVFEFGAVLFVECSCVPWNRRQQTIDVKVSSHLSRTYLCLSFHLIE